MAGPNAVAMKPARNSNRRQPGKESQMLRAAAGFFIIALIAAFLGFTGIAIATAGIAKILFYIFLVLFLLSLIGHLTRRT